MSASSQIRLSAFNTLLSTAGEQLAFNGGGSVAALVIRNLPEKDAPAGVRDGELDFAVKGLTRIEFPITGNTQPKPGDSFSDAYGFRHRVRMVEATEITWVSFCTVAQK